MKHHNPAFFGWGLLLAAGLSVGADATCATGESHRFSGEWSIDLRTPSQRSQNLDCGTAHFKLTQRGEHIEGEHSMATVGCGRLNEGGEKSVKGVVVGDTAVLVVTSGRNGEMVLGKAKRYGARLHWETVDVVRQSEHPGDSPLILGKGWLNRVR